MKKAIATLHTKAFLVMGMLLLTVIFVVINPGMSFGSYLEGLAGLYVSAHLLFVALFKRDTEVPGTQITLDASPALRVLVVCVALSIIAGVFYWGAQGWRP